MLLHKVGIILFQFISCLLLLKKKENFLWEPLLCLRVMFRGALLCGMVWSGGCWTVGRGAESRIVSRSPTPLGAGLPR